MDGKCEVVAHLQVNDSFSLYAIPPEAEYRGNTYIGPGKKRIEVEIYSTPWDEDDPDGMISVSILM